MSRLEQTVLGARFQNPVLLASGTCGYGVELDGVLDLDLLGGIVSKAVTPEPRAGNPAPRVAEFHAGMVNSVGLANVGLEEFRASSLPWLAARLSRTQHLVNVAGRTVDDYVAVIAALDEEPGFLGFELNVSCPNVKEGGAAFSTREDLLAEVVAAARASTRRPLVVKLSPNVPSIARMAEIAVAAGADALSLINTFPGFLFDVETRRPLLGAGEGGVSGAAILPMGVHAVRQARARVDVPIIGVGGIRSGADAIQYFLAGASLVQIGSATFANPRAALRVLTEVESYLRRHGMHQVQDLVGAGLAH